MTPKPKIRKQCEKCPWKVGSNPRDIPGDYNEDKHRGLARTIAEPGKFTLGGIHIMACHETPPGRELPCVGWLHNQLGVGNNLGLRMLAMQGKVSTHVRVVGRQHERFEDTLPEPE